MESSPIPRHGSGPSERMRLIMTRTELLESMNKVCDYLAIQGVGGFEATVSMAMDEILLLDRQVKELVALIKQRNQLDSVETRDRLAVILRETDHGTD